MSFPQPDPELALDYVLGRRDPLPLLAEARRLRDEGKGRTVTYSRKVFIPLTTLCRDTCTYCTFAKPPGAGGEYLSPDDVLAIAEAGQAHACTEALFTLGDAPEDRWPQYDRAAAARFMRRLCGCPYGYAGLAAAALLHLPIVRCFVRPNVDDQAVDRRPPFCSHACAMADRLGGGVDPVKHLADRLTEPADLAPSPFYRYLFTLA